MIDPNLPFELESSVKDKEHFKMTGINDDVRDILKTTGFDTIFF